MRMPVRLAIASVAVLVALPAQEVGVRAVFMTMARLQGLLVVLGTSAARLTAERGIALESVACLPSGLWTPSECPLCAAGMPLGR